MKVVGKSLPNIDAADRVTGKARYAGDVKIPGMLYARVLRSPLAHARIKSIDTKKALSLPGVVAVLTGADCPGHKYGAQIADEYVLAKEKVNFAGDEVAVVVAAGPGAAEEALGLVEVEYEELPYVIDPVQALGPGAAQIHGAPGNLAHRIELSRGDVDGAFARADLISEHEYSTPMVYHAYMEPTAAVADIDASGRIVLYSGLQDPMAARQGYSYALGIDPGKLRIKQMHVGGGFGGKLQPKAPLLCALAALRTGRAVKIINTREDDFTGSQPRVPMVVRIKLGATRDGLIIAKEARIVAGNGAYTRKGISVLLTSCYRIDALYKIPNLRAVGDLVYTNGPPTAAFRGYGNPQMHFAMECELDEVAAALGLDPLELRVKNGVSTGYVNPYGWRINSCGLDQCLEKVTVAAGWEGKRAAGGKGRGVGLACCIHVSGNRGARKEYDGSAAMVRIDLDGTVFVYSGEADMGQGARMVFAQIAAEVLGVPLGRVQVEHIDTDISPMALGTFASRVTYLGGNAVRLAAENARQKLLEFSAGLLEVAPEGLDIDEGVVFLKADPGRKLALAEVVRDHAYKNGGMSLLASGSFVPEVEYPDERKHGNVSGGYTYAAQAVEVEVDLETGHFEVKKVYAAHDLGRAINPVMAEGQVEGGIVMGLGWATTEQMIYKSGRLVNDQFLDYQIPTMADMPEMQVDLVESNEATGPFGAKGLGEPTIIPAAPAIANAIYHATGVRIRDLPITPDKIMRELKGL